MVDYVKKDRIAFITFNRPEAKNAIDPPTHKRLWEIWKDFESDNTISTLTYKSDQIKKLQDEYAETYGKNQNIKRESVKRKERINIIDKEFESWQNLLTNSEKMVNELNTRKNKLEEKLNKINKVKDLLNFKVNNNDIQNSYKIFLNGGFQGQDKHLFEMSSNGNAK